MEWEIVSIFATANEKWDLLVAQWGDSGGLFLAPRVLVLEIQFLEDLVLRFGGLKNSFYLCIRNSETGCSGVSAEKKFLEYLVEWKIVCTFAKPTAEKAVNGKEFIDIY